MAGLEKNEAPHTETNVVDKNTVTSTANTSLNKNLNDVITTSKKNLSYIFKLDATNKKLENINKKIIKLYDKISNLSFSLAEKNRLYIILEKHYYEIYVKRQELLCAFEQSLNLHGLTNANQVIEPKQREKFLKQFENAEQQKQMSELLDSLYVSLLNADIQQGVLADIQFQMTTLQKAMKNLNKQINDNQIILDDKTEEFAKVDKEGVLKSCEFSGPKVSIDDFVVNPQIELQMKKLISFYNNKSEAMKFGLQLPKGILLLGGPETGKSFAAKVFATEIGRKMFHIKAHDLFSEDISDPNEMLTTIFSYIIDYVKKNKESCIIFLDEIERIISSMGEYNPTAEKMISNTLIKNITNIQKSDLDIIIFGAIEQKNKIDERFLKYNLFDNQFFLQLPTSEERKRLFQLHIQNAEKRAKLKLFDSEMLDELVKKTEGFSAEYIKQLIMVCVKERFYEYLQNKSSFSIDQNFIGSVVAQINNKDIPLDDKNTQLSTKENILSRANRKKILNVLITQHTMKNLVFGEMDGEKKTNLLTNILNVTEGYSEDKINQFIPLCINEYQKRKTNYHKKSLISKEYILEKINELKEEDKFKGKSTYFSK